MPEDFQIQIQIQIEILCAALELVIPDTQCCNRLLISGIFRAVLMLNITGVNVAKVACFSDWFSDWATKQIKDVKDYLKQTTFYYFING